MRLEGLVGGFGTGQAVFGWRIEQYMSVCTTNTEAIDFDSLCLTARPLQDVGGYRDIVFVKGNLLVRIVKVNVQKDEPFLSDIMVLITLTL
jgi:hypothetical protein